MTKGIIVAIGGGEIGRRSVQPDGSVKQYPIETREIDAEIVRLSGKAEPRLLFIGTALGDSPGYFNVVGRYFSKEHGCRCRALKILDNPSLSGEEIRQAVFDSDIVYVGGGNTNLLIREWKRRGLDKFLKEALEAGIVLSGLSAGAICWFKHYCTDSTAIELGAENGTHLSMAEGLGFVDGIGCPHTLTEPLRIPYATEMLRTEYQDEVLYAIDDYAALVWEGGAVRSVVSSVGVEKGSSVRRITIENGELREERV